MLPIFLGPLLEVPHCTITFFINCDDTVMLMYQAPSITVIKFSQLHVYAVLASTHGGIKKSLVVHTVVCARLSWVKAAVFSLL